METREKSPPKHIVRAPSQALAVRSAALVARGLRDLARASSWIVRKAFSGASPQLAVSPTGQVCSLSPIVRQGTDRITVSDVERSGSTLALIVAGEPEFCPPGLPAAFAWSPTAHYLIAAWGGWLPELHVFDFSGMQFLGSFGVYQSFPSCMCWSASGKYFAAASRGGAQARMRLWAVSQESRAAIPFTAGPASELGPPGALDDWLETQPDEGEPGDEGTFSGFGRAAFSADETMLASAVEIEGDWADDSIVFLDVPTLRKLHLVPAQGHVTDIAWTPDSQHLIYCSAGQAYRLVTESTEAIAEALPFGAELCACHPHQPLCLCFSSWLKNSAKGRLFLVDLNRLTVYDEYAAEGVVDIRWSLDGSKAYAVTADGLAYIYEPPLL